MTAFVVTGTDTGIGKTVFAAGLTALIDGHYWKPVQAGLDWGSDAATVAALSGLPPERILREAYRLETPCSPHIAARIDGVEIDAARLALPDERPLVVEGAGGALVPLNDELLFADLFAQWGRPTIIVARTSLGTINHSLLTIEALHARNVPIHGIAFVGEEEPEVEETICRIGNVSRLGCLPIFDDFQDFASRFAEHFSPRDFT